MPRSKNHEHNKKTPAATKSTPAATKSNIAASKRQTANTSHENTEGLGPSPNMNSKRKRSNQVPIKHGSTGAGAGRPDTDERGEARPDKPPKRAKPAPKETAPTSKTKTTIPRNSTAKTGQRINEPPTAPLDIFVFGEGTGGELGLGSKIVDGQSLVDVMQPRLNKLLSSDDVGVVQIACGGMHAIALTRDNKILTWGVNDLGALGRATNVEEDEEDEMNPAESTPGIVDISGLEPNIRWAQVVASDNASFALTDDGHVYGWGTFRSSQGVIGFSRHAKVQKTPALVPDLKDIRQLATGTNHVLALDGRGKVFAWGCGEENELGRRWSPNHPELALRPTSIGNLPARGAKAVRVACGSYHNFAVDAQGRVYAWGLNAFAELGIPDEAGESNASHLKPRLVEGLRDHRIVSVAGGEHHSLASTADGRLLTWCRIDGDQVGLRAEAFTTDNTLFDDRGNPRVLKKPTIVPGIPSIALVAAGTDHSFALTTGGEAYSWGFSQGGRTGQDTEDDIKIPTLIDCESIRGKKLTIAGAGGSFSILACAAA